MIEDHKFRAEKVEFVLLKEETTDEEEAEWAISSQQTFDRVVMTTLDESPIHALT